ncbi:hypothetical protein GCM10008018_33360 [Paenibacillus marchantiophytorum]|uniref:Uncharacterized protein n=1 Tax=Paenibacillus marchantiophytorum TaxID=1619310 RepID=A0ABQ1ESI0_9BACL|nr:hypothetical protein [Paenibacillus marchantiophytorum]GFZ84702.1 hypothetical protein GCM10008018_33360 [Paenibacillus marchantiophytorum]
MAGTPSVITLFYSVKAVDAGPKAVVTLKNALTGKGNAENLPRHDGVVRCDAMRTRQLNLFVRIAAGLQLYTIYLAE